MSRLFTATLPFLAIFSLLACSPQENSRFGDAYWDPDDTWEKLGILEQPNLVVVYRNAGTEEAPVWQAYVAIDYSEIVDPNKPDRIARAVEFTYQAGLSEANRIPDAWLQNGAEFTDPKFYYDENPELPENDRDKRLRITTPGEYSLSLSFSAIQPSGKERDYDYIYSNIRVPGVINNYRYFQENVEPTLREHCTVCHADNSNPANSAFSMSNNSTTLRTNFLNKVITPTVGKPIRSFPFTSDHPGDGDAENLSSREISFYTNYIDALLEAQDDGSDITTDIGLITIAPPLTIVTDPFEPE